MEAGKVRMKKNPNKKSLRSFWVSLLTPARHLPPFIIQVSTLGNQEESEAGAGSQNQDGPGHTVKGSLSRSAYKSGFSAELGCVTCKCLILQPGTMALELSWPTSSQADNTVASAQGSHTVPNGSEAWKQWIAMKSMTRANLLTYLTYLYNSNFKTPTKM